MDTEPERVAKLAAVLGLPLEVLERHLIRPLPPPIGRLKKDWAIPECCRAVFQIADGFQLFANDDLSGFQFWGSREYDFWDGDFVENMVEEGVFPIYGEFIHMTSVSLADGTVVTSDLEEQGTESWKAFVAPSLSVYLQTLIQVWEAYDEKYGDEEDAEASEWWHSYAAHGDRMDLDSQ